MTVELIRQYKPCLLIGPGPQSLARLAPRLAATFPHEVVSLARSLGAPGFLPHSGGPITQEPSIRSHPMPKGWPPWWVPQPSHWGSGTGKGIAVPSLKAHSILLSYLVLFRPRYGVTLFAGSKQEQVELNKANCRESKMVLHFWFGLHLPVGIEVMEPLFGARAHAICSGTYFFLLTPFLLSCWMWCLNNLLISMRFSWE